MMKRLSLSTAFVIALFGTFSICVYAAVPILAMIAAPLLFAAVFVLTWIANLQWNKTTEPQRKCKGLKWCLWIALWGSFSAILIAVFILILGYGNSFFDGFGFFCLLLLFYTLPMIAVSVVDCLGFLLRRLIIRKKKSVKQPLTFQKTLLTQGLVFTAWFLILFVINFICFLNNEEDLWLMELLLIPYPTVILFVYCLYSIRKEKKSLLPLNGLVFTVLNGACLALYTPATYYFQQHIDMVDTILNMSFSQLPWLPLVVFGAEALIVWLGVLGKYVILSRSKTSPID